jgi:hypothetical protein
LMTKQMRYPVIAYARLAKGKTPDGSQARYRHLRKSSF